MTSGSKLQLLILRIVAYNIALAVNIIWPGSVGLLIAGGIVLIMRFVGGKALGDTGTQLSPVQKRWYFSTICLCAAFWLAWIVTLIARHASPQAWLVGSLGALVLAAALLYSYGTIYGPHAKV
jgi:hypothetical protein